jgi:hypothetical protein
MNITIYCHIVVCIYIRVYIYPYEYSYILSHMLFIDMAQSQSQFNLNIPKSEERASVSPIVKSRKRSSKDYSKVCVNTCIYRNM